VSSFSKLVVHARLALDRVVLGGAPGGRWKGICRCRKIRHCPGRPAPLGTHPTLQPTLSSLAGVMADPSGYGHQVWSRQGQQGAFGLLRAAHVEQGSC